MFYVLYFSVKLRIKTEFHQFDLKDEEADDEDSVSITVDGSDIDEGRMQEVKTPDKVIDRAWRTGSS